MKIVTLLLVGVFFTDTVLAYYSSSLGRWLSRDPVSELGSSVVQSSVQPELNGIVDLRIADIQAKIRFLEKNRITATSEQLSIISLLKSQLHEIESVGNNGNLYLPIANDPINNIDPNGEMVIHPGVLVVIIIAIIGAITYPKLKQAVNNTYDKHNWPVELKTIAENNALNPPSSGMVQVQLRKAETAPPFIDPGLYTVVLGRGVLSWWCDQNKVLHYRVTSIDSDYYHTGKADNNLSCIFCE